MTSARVVGLMLVAATAACGTSTDSLSCNNGPNFSCATINVSGGTLTNKTCTSGEMVASCSTSGIIGRCTINGIFGGTTCPASATCTSYFVVYTGGDTNAGMASCTQLGGTWSTN